MSRLAEHEQALSRDGVALLDIRDPETLSTYPFVKPVREALICTFDYLVAWQELIKTPDISGLTPEAVRALSKALYLPREFDKSHREALNEAYWIHLATRNMCQIAAKTVHTFFGIRYPQEYGSHIYRYTNPPNTKVLTYFKSHDFVAINTRNTGWHMAVSPANIFNAQSSTDLTTLPLYPRYKGQPFPRLTSVLLSRSLKSLYTAMRKIEGSGAEWYDATEFILPEYHKEGLSKFIRNWSE